MMTNDKHILMAMFDRAGVRYTVDGRHYDADTAGADNLFVYRGDNRQNDGYSNFYTVFKFDVVGLLSVGAWE